MSSVFPVVSARSTICKHRSSFALQNLSLRVCVFTFEMLHSSCNCRIFRSRLVCSTDESMSQLFVARLSREELLFSPGKQDGSISSEGSSGNGTSVAVWGWQDTAAATVPEVGTAVYVQCLKGKRCDVHILPSSRSAQSHLHDSTSP